MNHSNKPDQPIFDHSFSAFMLGLTFGALGAVLLGTQEGRDFTQKTINSLSNNLGKDSDLVKKMKSSIKLDRPETKKVISEDKTPPPSSFQEPPPPPPPSSNHPPRYFRNNTGGQLKGSL